MFLNIKIKDKYLFLSIFTDQQFKCFIKLCPLTFVT